MPLQVVTLPEYLKKRFGSVRIQLFFSFVFLIVYILSRISVSPHAHTEKGPTGQVLGMPLHRGDLPPLRNDGEGASPKQNCGETIQGCTSLPRLRVSVIFSIMSTVPAFGSKLLVSLVVKCLLHFHSSDLRSGTFSGVLLPCLLSLVLHMPNRWFPLTK